MIKCPSCSSENNLQKFCGNCGKPLLAENVEILIKKDDSEVPKKNKLTYSTQKFVEKSIVFVLMTFVGMKLFYTGALHLMPIFNDIIIFRKRYFVFASLSYILFT